MLSTNEILKTLIPYFSEIREAYKADKLTPLQKRIMRLATKVHDAGNGSGHTILAGFKAVNTHLSVRLNLLDFKTALQCKKTAPMIVTYLNLSQNVDKINEVFPFIERLQMAAESVLESISLSEVQFAGFVFPVLDSSLWFGLSDDVTFLNRQVCDLEKIPHVAAVLRLQHIAKENPVLLSRFQDLSFKKPWFFSNLDLCFGKILYLLKEEIESIADKIHPNVCRLFSDKQIIPLNFSLFTGEKLDKMIEGNGNREDIVRRIEVLNHSQLKQYMKKSSGVHFDKFSTGFYKTLKLSKLNKENAALLFKGPDAKNNLPLVSLDEIKNGFCILPNSCLRLLSPTQITAIDFSKMNENQFRALFTHYEYSQDKKRELISLIPPSSICHFLKLDPSIIEMLTKAQYLNLDVSLLSKNQVRTLFPGFAIESVFEGYEHTTMALNGVLSHRFEINSKSGSFRQRLSQQNLDKLLETEKSKCFAMVDNFSATQLAQMMPFMYPEAQKLFTFVS